MPEKAIIDKIDFNKSEQYILSIRLSTDGFSFSIYNPIRDLLILTHVKGVDAGISFAANLRQAFKELDFLSYAYKQVNVSLATKRFTLIPSELFVENQAEAYFYYNFSPKENEVVLHDVLNRNEAVILYAISKSLYALLKEHYPNVQLHSFISCRAEDFALKSRLGSDKKMYVCVYPDSMELYAYERGHLILLNSYACRNNSDRAYYLLYAWKQLAMNQLTDELWIAGEEGIREELVEDVRRFIQHVSTFNLTTEFNKP